MKSLPEKLFRPASWKSACLLILAASVLHLCVSLPPKLAYESFASAPLLDLDASRVIPELDAETKAENRWIFPKAGSFTVKPRKYYLVSAEVTGAAPFIIFFETPEGPLEKNLRAGSGMDERHLRAVIQNDSRTSDVTLSLRSLQHAQRPGMSSLRISELNPTYYIVRDTLEVSRMAFQFAIFAYMGWIALFLVPGELKKGLWEPRLESNEKRWLLLILAIAALLRIFNLGALSPFIDEITDITSPFSYSLRLQFGEGKFLGYWLIKPFAYLGQYLLADPLWLSRLAIALVGVLNTAMIYRWVRSLAGSSAGLWAAGFWALFPLTLIHERLALFDAVLVFFILLLLSVFPRRDEESAWKSGLILAAAMLVKITALFAIPWLLPLLWLSKKKPEKQDYFKCFQVAIYGGLLTGMLMLPWLGYFLEYSRNNAVHLPQAQAGLSNIFLNLAHRPLPNIERMLGYLKTYGGITPVFLAALVLLHLLRKPSQTKMVLAVCCLFSIGIHLVAFDIWYARYFLFHLVPFFALAGICLDEIFREFLTDSGIRSVWWNSIYPRLLFVCLAAVGIQWAAWDGMLVTTPYNLRVAQSDCSQYIEPSGRSVGMVMCREILTTEYTARHQPLTVFCNNPTLRYITEWKYRFGSGIKWETIADLQVDEGLQFSASNLAARINEIKGRNVIVAIVEPFDPKLHQEMLALCPGMQTITDLTTAKGPDLTLWFLPLADVPPESRPGN